MMSEAKKKEHDARFDRFMREITDVSRMEPKDQYIYKIMDGVPFKDLETALLMAGMDYKDNRKKTANANKKL